MGLCSTYLWLTITIYLQHNNNYLGKPMQLNAIQPLLGLRPHLWLSFKGRFRFPQPYSALGLTLMIDN